MIILSVFHSLDKLKTSNQQTMQQETNVTNIMVRLLFGLMLITINTVSMMLATSIGVDGQFIKDPYAQLGYMNGAVPSDAELKLALFVLTISRCMGGFALTVGLKHGQYAGHPQEQVRKSARLRAIWGLVCGCIFIFPEFWMNLAESYYADLSYLNGLFKRINS
ncbi:hypothetical protein [Vibrio sp. 10N.222.46.A1]